MCVGFEASALGLLLSLLLFALGIHFPVLCRSTFFAVDLTMVTHAVSVGQLTLPTASDVIGA